MNFFLPQQVLGPASLASVFLELLLQKEDYLRALRALLREIVRALRFEINLQVSQGLMTQWMPQNEALPGPSMAQAWSCNISTLEPKILDHWHYRGLRHSASQPFPLFLLFKCHTSFVDVIPQLGPQVTRKMLIPRPCLSSQWKLLWLFFILHSFSEWSGLPPNKFRVLLTKDSGTVSRPYSANQLDHHHSPKMLVLVFLLMRRVQCS